MNKEILKFIIKILLYALGLIGSYLGISSLTSCTGSRSIDGYGKTTIVTVDTTIINHSGVLKSK